VEGDTNQGGGKKKIEEERKLLLAHGAAKKAISSYCFEASQLGHQPSYNTVRRVPLAFCGSSQLYNDAVSSSIGSYHPLQHPEGLDIDVSYHLYTFTIWFFRVVFARDTILL